MCDSCKEKDSSATPPGPDKGDKMAYWLKRKSGDEILMFTCGNCETLSSLQVSKDQIAKGQRRTDAPAHIATVTCPHCSKKHDIVFAILNGG